jgi:HlyD family secretion protein
MGNKKKLSVFLIVAIVTIIAASVLYFSGILLPSALQAGSFETSVVDRGEVISSINATGVVESENEVLILSPASSIIKKVIKEPGSRVEKGEVIVQLDTEPVEDEIGRLQDQLEVRRNNLDKTQLSAQSTRVDLDFNEEVKKLKITSLKSTLADQKQLLEVGGISPARVENTKQEITLAEKDLQMLIQKNSIRLKQLEADKKGLMLQIGIDEKNLKEKQELLSKMSVKAPSSGIILTVSGHEGEKINADRTLIRMSDLTTFKIIGSVEEQYAKQIKTGNPVLVNIDTEELQGTIGNVTPMVENNKIQFNVHLNESNHPKLIANQQVQIQIITGVKENSLRIKRLPDFEKSKNQKIFVINGNKAERKEVTLGILGNQYCEIVSGLKEGDVIITDGTNSFRHLNKIEIKN